MQGLGQPVNWIIQKFVARFLQRHLHEILQREARPVIQQELNNVTETDLLALHSGLTSIFSVIPDCILT